MTTEAENDGAGAYGTRHIMEEQMRAADQGVFSTKEGVPDRPLAKMTKAELVAEAAKCNVSIDPDDTKAQIIAKIEAA